MIRFVNSWECPIYVSNDFNSLVGEFIQFNNLWYDCLKLIGDKNLQVNALMNSKMARVHVGKNTFTGQGIYNRSLIDFRTQFSHVLDFYRNFLLVIWWKSIASISKILVQSDHKSRKVKNRFLSEIGCECRSALTCILRGF